MPVEQVFVDIGDSVTAGELLVQFYAGELTVELEALHEEISALEGQLAAVHKKQTSQSELSAEKRDQLFSGRVQTQARLSKMQSQLAWAEVEHRRLTAVASGGAISRRELQQSASTGGKGVRRCC